MTWLASERPKNPMSEKTRKFIAVATAVWIVIGLAVANSKLSTLEGNARTLYIVIVLFDVLAGISAVIYALRGKRRATIILLALSSLYPAYFSRVLSLIPIALVFLLLIDSWRISARNHLMSRRKIWLASTVFIALMGSLTWMQLRVDPMASTETKRVQHAFQQITDNISKKEGVPTLWLTPVRAGDAKYPDGSKASLWVPKPSPQGDRSNCFYVDQIKKNTSYGYIYFECNSPKAAVVLQRQHAVVVGFLSDPKANFVTVTAGRSTARVPVTFGYFIVPGAISSFPLAKFTITYTDLHQATCEVVDLGAPGSVDAARCTIA